MPATTLAPAAQMVRHFRQVLLWPLRVLPQTGAAAGRPPWQALRELGEASPWHEQVDDYFGPQQTFHERHYHEFVTFLPYVQRFLYGEGRAGRDTDDADGGAPMRLFRRRDVAALRAVTSAGQAPITLRVQHIDLYFFFDVDVVLLNVEVEADDLTLAQAQELMYRFGRGYPPGWDANGEPMHCLSGAEWLGADGRVLAASDAQQREAFLAHVADHRAPRLSAHWAWLLEPLVADHSGREGALRLRQIEYYRMPTMAYLALDEPRALTRGDFVRLGLVTGAGSDAVLPYSEPYLADFEARHCYDRHWSPHGLAPDTRYLCCGHAMVVLGRADTPFFRCAERGVLAQFRHEHFLIFLIAHFQKAALMMFSDRLVEALKRLHVRDADSVRRFKRAIRASFEGFLRFTHRYWFHEVAEQAQARALFRLTVGQLETDTLYADVKQRIADMSAYLDADSLRRQANTVVRLTVVTIFGLIGTVTTGFLGMNLLAEAEAPLWRRLALFAAVAVASAALTIYTMVKSKRLSDFLDVLSEERVPAWTKARAFFAVWRRSGPE
ncbi:conserved hypothetical protein [Rubrivivax sp. A210]|uniref:hypothetical protein n=1 Tax=Rubrivivax sp. A210 TaxID=2772301 RepID=UPI0019180901|nr:hypothetical protein [Rubrivivax sp. A210]CAD5373299.1 conserved hypothetical protein [Rubrivivax sp. A210]